MMVSLQGLFDLKPQTDKMAFSETFDAFCRHLQSKGYVASWHLAERLEHPGYDRRPPMGRLFVTLDFPDRAAAEACFAYVAADEEPLRGLHRAMNSKVEKSSTSFFLTRDVPARPS